MRASVWLSAIVVGFGPYAAHAQDAKPGMDRDLLLRRGIELRNAGNYQGAIETYQKILESNPRDAVALYEIGSSYLALGDSRNCMSFAGRSVEIQPGAYSLSLLANCQEEGGDVPGALDTFAKALDRYPGDVMLNSNYAVTLARLNRGPEAKQRLQVAIKADPLYASPFLTYAGVLEAEPNSVGALYMWLRFLMLEPGSQRSPSVAQRVYALISPLKKGEKAPTVTTDISGTRAGRDEFPTDLDFMQLLFHRTKAPDKKGNGAQLKPADLFVKQSELVLALFAGSMVEKNPQDLKTFVWQVAGMPLTDLGKRKLMDPFLYYIAGLANVEGSHEWLSAHEQEFNALKEHLFARD